MELNKIIRSVLFLTAGVVLTSCIEVNGSGYSSLSESEKTACKEMRSSYNTDNYQKYGELFYKSLTQCDDENRRINSYHYFNNGKYVCSYE